jgi:hypothetical protein
MGVGATIPVKRVQVDTPPGWDNETMLAEHDGNSRSSMWERSCVEGNAAHGMVATEGTAAAPGK